MSNRRLDIGGDFGDYRVVKLLGTSGRVDVYLMRSSSSGEFFAMKTFLPPDGTPEDFKERFSSASDRAMRVSSESIAQIRDFGEDPETGLLYLLMDYVDGGTLAEYIAVNGALDVAEALKTAIVAAYALEAVHAAGIVHGGVTSCNMMFMQDGSLKLTDMEMAKVAPRASLISPETLDGPIPPHVAPEQVLSGTKVDFRTDIYSLGIALFEMLAGRRPESTQSVLEFIVKTTNGELVPDVRTVRADVPAVVAEAVAKLCAIKPEERPHSAGEAAEILMAALREIGGLDDSENDESGDGGGGSGGGARRPLKLRRVKMRVHGKMPTITAAYEDKREDEGGGLGKLFAVLVILAIIAAGVFVVLMRAKDSDGADDVLKVAAEAEDVNDATVRSAKIGDFTWFYTVEHSKAVLWRGYDGFHGKPCIEPTPTGRVIVPDSIEGFKVGALGALAFHDCADITHIELPDTLERIGNRAFIYCRALEEVAIPDKVKQIGKWAFNSCSKLRRIEIAKCTEIEDGGGNFAYCPKLEEITASPDNPKFKSVGGVLYSADGKCLVAHPAKCETVEVPDGVEEIGEYAFCDSHAKRISLPSSVVRIGQGAFKNCRAAKEIVFAGAAPEVMTGNDAIFKNASSLISVMVKKDADGWPPQRAKWPQNDGRNVRYAFTEIAREWRDAKGRMKEATLVGIAEAGSVAIMRNPGEDRVRSLTIAKLSDADQEFIYSIAKELRNYVKRGDRYEPTE